MVARLKICIVAMLFLAGGSSLSAGEHEPERIKLENIPPIKLKVVESSGGTFGGYLPPEVGDSGTVWFATYTEDENHIIPFERQPEANRKGPDSYIVVPGRLQIDERMTGNGRTLIRLSAEGPKPAGGGPRSRLHINLVIPADGAGPCRAWFLDEYGGETKAFVVATGETVAANESDNAEQK